MCFLWNNWCRHIQWLSVNQLAWTINRSIHFAKTTVKMISSNVSVVHNIWICINMWWAISHIEPFCRKKRNDEETCSEAAAFVGVSNFRLLRKRNDVENQSQLKEKKQAYGKILRKWATYCTKWGRKSWRKKVPFIYWFSSKQHSTCCRCHCFFYQFLLSNWKNMPHFCLTSSCSNVFHSFLND